MPGDLSTWYHKFTRQKGTVLIVVPATVMHDWDPRGAHYAKIRWEGERIVVEPLTRAMQPCFTPQNGDGSPRRG